MEADTRQRMSQTPVPALDQLQKRLGYYVPDIISLENQYDHQSSCTTSLKIDAMKDTEKIYDWGRILVERRYRLIRHLLLMSLIGFLAFPENMYGKAFIKKAFSVCVYGKVQYLYSLSYLCQY